MNDHPDYLRSPELVCKPDRRSPKSSFLTNEPLTIEHHHSAIADISLHKGVPEDIRVQFETTKNIYLYAWFVYRFYPVANLHSYTCLELALRERFEANVLASRKKKRKATPTLKELMNYAIEKEHLQNEDFSVWQHQVKMRAQHRGQNENLEEMRRLGLSEMLVDETRFEIKDADRDHDYLSVILEALPNLRNHYAHGAWSLDNQALGTIKLVSEIINQIYPEENKL